MKSRLKKRDINNLVSAALAEDCAEKDITSALLVPKNSVSDAHIIVREEAVICGLEISKAVFKKLHKGITFRTRYQDGQKVKKNTKAATLRGNTRAILSAERTALNILGYLSGIATLTSLFVAKAKPYGVKILDTRKTTPGLRLFEKYAVRCGGGENHRSNLNEMILIKDNHWAAMSNGVTLENKIKRIRKMTQKTIEVEVDNLFQLKKILKADPNIVLLDNMSLRQLKAAVKMNKNVFGNRTALEASGGINLNNVKRVAQTKINRISVGSLTHSVKNINFNLEIKNRGGGVK